MQYFANNFIELINFCNSWAHIQFNSVLTANRLSNLSTMTVLMVYLITIMYKIV